MVKILRRRRVLDDWRGVGPVYEDRDGEWYVHKSEPAWLWPLCVGGPIIVLSIVLAVFA